MIRFKFVIRLTDFNFQLADRDARNQLRTETFRSRSRRWAPWKAWAAWKGRSSWERTAPRAIMGQWQHFTKLAALSLGSLALLSHPLIADEPASQRSASRDLPPALPSSPPGGADHDLVDRLRKLEAANQAILDRLDRSERERQRSDERYRTLESRYEELRKRIGQNPEPPSSPSTVPGNRAQPPSENEASGVAHGRDNPEKPNGLSRAFADS